MIKLDIIGLLEVVLFKLQKVSSAKSLLLSIGLVGEISVIVNV